MGGRRLRLSWVATPNVSQSRSMKAAWYENQGPAAEVLIVGEMPDPQPERGEVRIRVAASGINPGDVKKRQDTFGLGMPFPRVIPHSDGAGTIDRVGEGVPASRVAERVWCFGAQSYRPFGTAAEYVVVPSAQAVPLSAGVSFDQGACLGTPRHNCPSRCTRSGASRRAHRARARWGGRSRPVRHRARPSCGGVRDRDGPI